MNVVRLVVEYGEFIDLPNDLAEIGSAVGRFSDWLIAKWGQKIVPKVIVVERGFGHVAKGDAMNVGQTDVAHRTDDADIVLDVERYLKVVAPIAACVSVVGQYGVVKEDA